MTDERRRRELAHLHRDDIDDVYAAVPVKPKALGQIMSVRLPGEVAGRLRDHAISKGESVSDLVRRAVFELLDEPALGFRCRHVSIVSHPGFLQSASAYCGCVMRKVFDPAELADATAHGISVPVDARTAAGSGDPSAAPG
jgi:hypothetical protein